MPHEPTSPSESARAVAAAQLRESAKALRELAYMAAEHSTEEHALVKSFLGAPVGLSNEALIAWSTTHAIELEAVADWLSSPFGRCDECGEVLQHFTSENVGGVMCPDCDREHVAELAPPACEFCGQRCERRMLFKNGETCVACDECKSLQLDPCALCRHSRHQHLAEHGLTPTFTACECCSAHVFHVVDPELPQIAGAIAHALRTRRLHELGEVTAEEGRAISARRPFTGLAEEKRARVPCSTCGALLIIDHTECFSDDCQRARAEKRNT